MTREQFTKAVTDTVQLYIDNFDRFGANPQIRVNPATLAVTLETGDDLLSEIADNDEALESAAGAQGAATEEASDFQVRQNPDFYAAADLVEVNATGHGRPCVKAIDRVVSNYFDR